MRVIKTIAPVPRDVAIKMATSNDTPFRDTPFHCCHCGADIDNADIARHFASRGGRKSRRTITLAQQRKMQLARHNKKS